MAKIDAVRLALESDDTAAVARAIDGYPACADAAPVALLPTQPSPRDTGCFAAIANSLGSKKGFAPKPPDQAAATTVALVMLRDGRGDWVAHSDDWLTSLRSGKGPGVDALRMAVARKMAEAAPHVGKHLDDEADAQKAMKAIVAAIPGACPTYWLLGSGVDPKDIAAEHSADHAACVQTDLKRREGPGGTYGSGTFRALEGSLSLWRDAERALRVGLPSVTTGAAKAMVETKLASIELATRAIAAKKIGSAGPDATVRMLGELHADAGISLWKSDAGVDGGVLPKN